ncbi:branched-chain amino acid transporter permease [Limosilactobacillus mucosae]|uniref:branched-chain amino acid transporter permease n=1 Tax=Limosilactobacillus mucosae TaxID=97478 RepID=UPI00233EC622|nr:AzlD domain-containing protein [Limosilactobacillus mucosae]MDC2843117.1 AzlD domain-containing protein [Limosilactobacillus mucosae]
MQASPPATRQETVRFAFNSSLPIFFGYVILGTGYGLYMHNLGFGFWFPTIMAAATPDFVTGLGRFLPAAIMGMLVVYCYRNVNWLGGTHGLPEVIAGVVTVIVHLWKHSLFLTLIVGTLCYMLLINFIF